MAFRNAFYFVSTYASAPIPTKQRPYAFWGLPALAIALHGWQRMRDKLYLQKKEEPLLGGRNQPETRRLQDQFH